MPSASPHIKPSRQERDEKKENEELTRTLTFTLLHVFAPLLNALADSLLDATPVVASMPNAESQQMSSVPCSPSPKAQSSTFPSSPTHAELTATLLAESPSPFVEQTVRHINCSRTSSTNHDNDGDVDTPSPRNATCIFNAHEEAECGTRQCNNNTSVSVDSTFSSSPMDVGPASPLSATHASSDDLSNNAASASPLSLKNAPGNNGAFAIDKCAETATPLLLVCLPNAVLWEAVAALAEAMVMDGACVVWLSKAIAHRCVRQHKRAARGSSAEASTPAAAGEFSPTAADDENGKAEDASLLLCRALFEMDRSAAEALRSLYGARRDSRETAQESQRETPPAPASVNVFASSLAEALYPAVAAVFVRCVALHTAHLLRPLSQMQLAAQAQSTSSATPFDTSPIGHAATSDSAAPHFPVSNINDGCFCGAAHAVDISERCGYSEPFRAVQARLKLQHRQASNGNSFSAKAAAAALFSPDASSPPAPQRRVLVLRGRGGGRRSATSGISRNTGSVDTAAWVQRVLTFAKAAEASDYTCFALVTQERSPRVSEAPVPQQVKQEEKEQDGVFNNDAVERVQGNLVDRLLGAGASLAAQQHGASLLVLSCPLPEARCTQLAQLPSSLDNNASTVLRGNVDIVQDHTEPSFLCLRAWCAGVQQLATVGDFYNTSDNNSTSLRTSEKQRDFTLAAVRVHRSLGSSIANTAQYDKCREHSPESLTPLLSPSGNAVERETSAEGDESKVARKREGEEEEEEEKKTEMNSAAQWSIRPLLDLAEATDAPEEETHSSDDALSPLKRRKGETLPFTAFPQAVSWWSTAPPLQEGCETSSGDSTTVSPLCEPRSTASLLHPLIKTEESSPAGLAEALSEVGSVLAAVDTACVSRTLIDATAWRYGRNRFHVAAASHISVCSRAPANEDAQQVQPETKHASSKGAVSTDEKAVTRHEALNASDAIGLYHHESGVLYLSDGSTHAMEIE